MRGRLTVFVLDDGVLGLNWRFARPWLDFCMHDIRSS